MSYNKSFQFRRRSDTFFCTCYDSLHLFTPAVRECCSRRAREVALDVTRDGHTRRREDEQRRRRVHAALHSLVEMTHGVGVFPE